MQWFDVQALMAMASPQPGQGGGSGGPVFWIGYLLIFGGLLYVMVVMPQRRKEKERKELLSKTKTGDKVIFGGGLIGTVANVKEHTLVVKVADNVKIEILRGAVLRVLDKEEDVKEPEA